MSVGRVSQTIQNNRTLRELLSVARKSARVLVDSHSSINPSLPPSSHQDVELAINQIQSVMNRVIPADFGIRFPTRADFDRHHQSSSSSHHHHYRSSPCFVVEIHNEPLLTLIIFCLKDSQSNLPLHDHVGMHGFLRVLRGQARVTSYSWPRTGEHTRETSQMSADDAALRIPSVFHSSLNFKRDRIGTLMTLMIKNLLVSPSDETLVLRPDIGNVHEITNVSDESPLIFFDLLTPSYEHTTRDCHYYRPVPTTTHSSNEPSPGDVVDLQPIPSPSSYWTINWPPKER